jgi:branched-chain amino acid transport system ATP-binding protein
MKEPLLEVNGINHFFGGLHAVQEVSFRVDPGQIKAVIGPNGAGKTTLFNLISGYLKPASGTVRLAGRPITGLRPFRIAKLGIGRTFQTTRLFPQMTVLENVMVGRHTRTRTEFLPALFAAGRREERETRTRALDVLETLGISRLRDEAAGSLAFGQQRWVELARALAAEPSLLLLDEPAAGLNLSETDELAELILRIRGWGVTILLVEHDMAMVMNVSDEVVVLSYGRKLTEGSPQAVQADPQVIAVYLGDGRA